MKKHLWNKIISLNMVLTLLSACAFLHHKVEHAGTVAEAEARADFFHSKDTLLYRSKAGAWVLGADAVPLFDSKYKILDFNPSASVFVLSIDGEKDSDLFIFDRSKKSLRSVKLPKPSAIFTRAALSPDGKTIAAVARSEKYDRIYLVDCDTLVMKEASLPKKQFAIGLFAWNLSGSSVYYVETSFIGLTILQYSLQDNSTKVIYDSPFSPFWEERVPEKLAHSPMVSYPECGGASLQVLNNSEGRNQEKFVQIQKSGKKFETILKISDRERACPDCQGFMDLNLQFSHDCRDIFFSLGDKLMVYNLESKRVGKYADGEQLYILP